MREQLFCKICGNALNGNQKMYCCNNCKQKAHYNNETKNNPNSYHSQERRAIVRKLKLMELSGNKCCICGYNKNIAVLEFHHKISALKEFSLDKRSLSNYNWDKIQEEYIKCELLCANCHRELHYPECDINTVKENISQYESEVMQKTFNDKKELRKCLVCEKEIPNHYESQYCSNECRIKSKGYPDIEEINSQYKILKSWEKVANYFGTTRRIIDGVRRRNTII